jgi:O-acetyl-ADP-ribose deacetylase (regulator of RNase III)
LAKVINERKISSIALPPLGSGLGGLDWDIVKIKIESLLANLTDVDIMVYEPNEIPPEERIVKNKTIPNMTPGRAALVSLASRYLGGLLDPFVTLLELHKLMYLLQECGEPLRLRFVKAPHGPYAENLSHVLNAIEGYLLTGYADGGDKPNKQNPIVPGAERDAIEKKKKKNDTAERIDRVTKLVRGFETPFGMELLTTVHWVTTHEMQNMQELVNRVYAWGPQKEMFNVRQIGIAEKRLKNQGWIAS